MRAYPLKFIYVIIVIFISWASSEFVFAQKAMSNPCNSQSDTAFVSTLTTPIDIAHGSILKIYSSSELCRRRFPITVKLLGQIAPVYSKNDVWTYKLYLTTQDAGDNGNNSAGDRQGPGEILRYFNIIQPLERHESPAPKSGIVEVYLRVESRMNNGDTCPIRLNVGNRIIGLYTQD